LNALAGNEAGPIPGLGEQRAQSGGVGLVQRTLKAIAARSLVSSTSVLVADVVAIVVMTLAAPGFSSFDNLQALALSVSVTAIVGFSQMVVIGAGGLNLSVGAVGGLVAMATGGLMMSYGTPPVLAIAIGLGIGLGCGALNGILIARTGISPFIVTLATSSIFTGIDLGVTEVHPYYNLPADFTSIAGASVAGIPVLTVIMLAIAAALAVFFRSVGLGRQILAYGASPRAAELAGVPPAQTIIAAYAISGLLGAVAAVLVIARLGSAQPLIGSDWLLGSFAAPIIGGTLLAGGSVSVLGALGGSVLLAVIASAMVFASVDPYWTTLVSGGIILAAVVVDRLRTAREGAAELAERRKR